MRFRILSASCRGVSSEDFLPDLSLRIEMCIRDRHESDANAGIRYKKKSIELELLAQNLTNQRVYVVNKQIKAVSYTHLDVYKRQAQYYAKVNQPAMAMKYALQSSEYNDSDLIGARKTQLQQEMCIRDRYIPAGLPQAVR